MFAELVVLVRAIGKATIDGVAKVGLGILRTLFPTEVLRRLIKEGRAFFNYNGLSLFPVWQPVYAEAFAGGSNGRALRCSGQ